jgi:hypothetical protein
LVQGQDQAKDQKHEHGHIKGIYTEIEGEQGKRTRIKTGT